MSSSIRLISGRMEKAGALRAVSTESGPLRKYSCAVRNRSTVASPLSVSIPPKPKRASEKAGSAVRLPKTSAPESRLSWACV